MDVMQHVVSVESSFNRYAIGVVGGRLVRQPSSLGEAVATARMLRDRGFNFSLGLAQVNRYNLSRYGLTFERAFQACPNLQAGARILADCLVRSGNDWGKSFSCYYSGNFVTGFREGYVQKVFASMRRDGPASAAHQTGAIDVVQSRHVTRNAGWAEVPPTLVARRVQAETPQTAAVPAPAPLPDAHSHRAAGATIGTAVSRPSTPSQASLDIAFVF